MKRLNSSRLLSEVRKLKACWKWGTNVKLKSRKRWPWSSLPKVDNPKPDLDDEKLLMSLRFVINYYQFCIFDSLLDAFSCMYNLVNWTNFSISSHKRDPSWLECLKNTCLKYIFLQFLNFWFSKNVNFRFSVSFSEAHQTIIIIKYCSDILRVTNWQKYTRKIFIQERSCSTWILIHIILN